MTPEKSYVPAAGHDWLLPLYDSITKLMGADRPRAQLVDQAGLRQGQRILDVGCGTGTLPLLVKRLHPGVDVVGLDPDPKALQRAQGKAKQAGVAIQFDQGFSDKLPYEASSFDHVFSSYMFHHLESGDKEAMLREIRRVLKPGGRVHLLDFSADNDGGHSLSRLFHSDNRLQENSTGRILELMERAGLQAPRERQRSKVMLGLAKVASYEAAA